VSFTKRLTSWVKSPDRDPLDGYEVSYGVAESLANGQRLVVQKQARFFELELGDTGAGVFLAGIHGAFSARCCFRLDDESGLDDVLNWLVEEVRSWESFAWGPSEPSPVPWVSLDREGVPMT
jgi:hypothetical protein